MSGQDQLDTQGTDEPEVGIDASFDAADDAADDAALDRLFGGAEPAAEPEPATRSDADGDTGGEPAPADATPGTEPASMDREQALAVLRRDGWKPEDFEGWTNDRLIERATHRRRVQAEGDRVGNELAAARRGTNAEPDAPPEGEMARLYAIAREKLGDEFAGQLKNALGRMEMAAAQAEAARMERDVATTRDKLRATMPAVADEALWSKVIEKAQQIGAGGGYDTLDSLLGDAARLVLPVNPPTHLDGVSDVGARRGATNAGRDADPDDEAFDMLKQGVAPSEVNRRIFSRT